MPASVPFPHSLQLPVLGQRPGRCCAAGSGEPSELPIARQIRLADAAAVSSDGVPPSSVAVVPRRTRAFLILWVPV